MRSLKVIFILFLVLSCTNEPPSIYGKWKLVKSEYKTTGKIISSKRYQGSVEAIFSTDGTFTTLYQGSRINFFPYEFNGKELTINQKKTDFYFKGDTLFLATDKSQGIVDVYIRSSIK